MRRNERKLAGAFVMTAVTVCCGIVMTVPLSTDAGNGLSNEIFLNKQWHDLDAPQSLIVNPSFAARTDWPTLSVALSTTQMGLFYLMNTQCIIPLTPLANMSQTLGLSYTGLSAGSFEKSTWEHGIMVREEERANTYSEQYGTLSYAFIPFDFYAVGINFNIVRQSNFGAPVVDGAVDIGMSFLLDHHLLGKHTIGICMLNPARLTRYEKPVFTPDFGVSWHFEKTVSGFDIKGGIEANYRSLYGDNFSSTRKDATARIGAAVYKTVSLFIQGGRTYAGISCAIDMDSSVMHLPASLRRLTGAYQLLFTEEQFRPTNTAYLSVAINRNRNVVAGGAYDIYLRALAAYREEKYWDAYALFTLLAKEEPRFFKIDEVRLYAAQSCEKMCLIERTIEGYRKVKKFYKHKSARNEAKIIGGADLGLLQMYVKTEDSVTVMTHFTRLLHSPADDSIKQTAWYIAGQYYLMHHDTLNALTAFGHVRSNHPDFPFAQYAKGICHYVTNDADFLIEKSFKEAIENRGRSPAEREIGFMARYALGCFYYENKRFADAQRYIEKIPDTSSVFYDGCAVVGWGLLKSKLWNECRHIAQKMQESYTPDIQAEGYLLEAYTLMNDTACPQTRLACLSRALAIIEKATVLVPSMERYVKMEVLPLFNENDSLLREQEMRIGRYRTILLAGEGHAVYFKSISDLRPVMNYCQYRIHNNLFNIDLARHYRQINSRVTNIAEDILYLNAKVKMLYEREKMKHDNSSTSVPNQQLKRTTRSQSTIHTDKKSPATVSTKTELQHQMMQKIAVEKIDKEIDRLKNEIKDQEGDTAADTTGDW